jgi:hypothetical protein
MLVAVNQLEFYRNLIEISASISIFDTWECEMFAFDSTPNYSKHNSKFSLSLSAYGSYSNMIMKYIVELFITEMLREARDKLDLIIEINRNIN